MQKRLKIEPIITTGYRDIIDGSSFDKYFPQVKNEDRTIVGNREAEVDDVVVLMQKVVWKYLDDTKELAPILQGKNLKDTIVKIWDFLYHHIQYQLDKSGLEQLRRPARLWHDKIGDCDDFAMAASSILTNLGIAHKFRITKYGKPNFQHVYVIVPNGHGHYVIDPVLSLANYEKPFTEKKDFNMNLNGIDVAVLEGFGNADSELVNDLLLDDLDGLGSLTDQQADQKMYKYLVKTREYTLKNKKSVGLYEDADSFIKMLDYAIKYWHTPKREEALAILAKNEEDYNIRNGFSGFDDEDEELDETWDDLSGLSNAEVIQFLEDVNNPELDGLGFFKKWFKKVKKKSKKFWGKVKKGIKKVGKVLVRYNPASIAIRNGFLLAMKINLFKFAQRLKWGYATKAQIKGKITEAYWRKSQKTLKRVRNIFVNKLQGKESALKKAILKGRSGGLHGIPDTEISDHFKGQSIQGLGAIATGTLVSAASAILAFIGKIFKKNKLGKEERPKVTSGGSSSGGGLPTKSAYVDNGYTDNGGGSSPIVNGKSAYASDFAQGGNPQKAGILSKLKKNPMYIALGVAVIGGLGYLAYSTLKDKKTHNAGALKGLDSKVKVEKLK